MKSKTLWIIFLILVIAVGGYFMFVDKSNNDTTTEPVDVEADFGSKVVYTSDMSVDTAALEADCELRGGEFNECGSVCEPDAEICTEQCAYTCDDINPENSVLGDSEDEVDESNSSATSSDETTTSSATSTN